MHKPGDKDKCANLAVNTIQMPYKLDGKKGETREIDKETTLYMNKQEHSNILPTTDSRRVTSDSILFRFSNKSQV